MDSLLYVGLCISNQELTHHNCNAGMTAIILLKHVQWKCATFPHLYPLKKYFDNE